jgi:hypothetical protein
MAAVTLVKKSKNSKLGANISATYASIEKTCPDSCGLKGKGCYAQTGYVGITNARLNKSGQSDPSRIAREEAILIDQSFDSKSAGGKIIRLHVSGDSRTRKGTTYLANAAKRFLQKGGEFVYSYTHAWKTVPRKFWGKVSIMASCDSFADANLAMKSGYAPTTVVQKFPSTKAFTVPGSSVTWIPCPSQTIDRTCSQCKLCMRADYLHSKQMGIAFEAHGSSKKKIKLNVLAQ